MSNTSSTIVQRLSSTFTTLRSHGRSYDDFVVGFANRPYDAYIRDK